ncbi:MAG TPA: glycosyltransferase family 4 protein [Anaerolineaceae bacterium]|nr:glycosyltransferase family 4 protein [Anaerolineaceae bacterium]HPN50196.1 glycosyltransferase family 4 protein [Anaerolineaceae bacterium]
MRILIALTYFQPHKSGLTIYATRLAKAFVARGHQVTVLTSQYNPSLPLNDQMDGVNVVRVPVWFRLSKGPIMPGMLFRALGLLKNSDLINLHLPQFDAAPLSVASRMMGKPVLVTYHCDLRLPPGPVNALANWGSNLVNHLTCRLAHRMVTNTLDYAEHSSFLRPYLSKLQPVRPPVTLARVDEAAVQRLREKLQITPDQKIIGMVARFATEKGVEYLVDAMPEVLKKEPAARVLFVGEYQNVFGEQEYARRLMPMIEKLGKRWDFLGSISDEDLAAFYKLCHVTVLPSINSTESYGIVQIEAMRSGVPSVASDLPGIRQPVKLYGMGRVFEAGNARALAEALTDVLANPEKYAGDPERVAASNSPDAIAMEYEAIFAKIIHQRGNA